MPSIVYGCCSARLVHGCTTAKGPSRSLQRMLVLCFFSAMADRSVCGSAIPSWDAPLPQVALFVCYGLWASLLPKEPAEPAGSSLRRRRVLCFLRCGDSTVPWLRFVLAFDFQVLGGHTPGELCAWSRRASRTSSLRPRSGSRSSGTSTSFLRVFLTGTQWVRTDMSTPQSVQRVRTYTCGKGNGSERKNFTCVVTVSPEREEVHQHAPG